MELNHKGYVIKQLTKIEELEPIVDLQNKIWGFSLRDCVPSNYLIVCASTGGDIFGAFLKDKLVGFCMTTPAFDDKGRINHHAHMMGVIPEERGSWGGVNLIKAQYFQSKRMGIDKITCTYDPLEPINAFLYIHRFGGIVESRYKIAEYEFESVERNIPSDRFLVTWHLDSERVSNAMNNFREHHYASRKIFKNYKLINKVNSENQLMDFEILKENKIAVEIPNDYIIMRNERFDDALKWREGTRKIFSYYLENDYKIVDIISTRQNLKRKHFYLIEKTIQ